MSIENCLGLDIETTGLDPVADGILEVGMKVVKPDFSIADIFLVYIKQPAEILARMSPAVKAQHERSGLLRDCEEHGVPHAVACSRATAFVAKHFADAKAILLGSSIHFDRSFVKS